MKLLDFCRVQYFICKLTNFFACEAKSNFVDIRQNSEIGDPEVAGTTAVSAGLQGPL